MAFRRLCYLAALAGCLVLYVFYREWMAWLLLLTVACLPFVSLLVSLPAMCTVKMVLRCPTEVSVGQSVRPQVQTECRFPAPVVRCRLKLRHCITGEKQTLMLGSLLPTENCGSLEIAPTRLWVYDYLGLWRFPRGGQKARIMAVLPQPVEPQMLPAPQMYTAAGFKPRPGGGFAENHELRQYRPGDDLRHIHWKLAAKTGKLIYREPVEPMRRRMVVALELSGDGNALDRKLGELSWIAAYLLERKVTFEIRCMTGRGVETYRVTDRPGAEAAMRAILSSPAAAVQQKLSVAPGTFYIGGEGT